MDNIKDNIIKTSKALFIKYGLRSVSIDDICNKLHISKKTFYTYFSQKEKLITDVVKTVFEEKKHCEKKKKFTTNEEGLNIIDIIMKTSSKFIITHEKLFVNLFYDLEKYYPHIMKKYDQETLNDIYNVSIFIINTGIKEGLFREDIEVDKMSFLISRLFFSLPYFVKESKMNLKELTALATDTYIRILVNEKGLKYYLTQKEDKKKDNK